MVCAIGMGKKEMDKIETDKKMFLNNKSVNKRY